MRQEHESSKASNTQESEVPFFSPRIQKAYNMAEKAHEGQFRKSGEPFITHPVAVEQIIHEEWGVEGEDMRIAALLHDTVEDTDLTIEEIEGEFGTEVAFFVSSVTNLEASTTEVSLEEWKKVKDRENQRKILAGSFLDASVSLIKLADRLHNMRTLGSMSESKRREIAEETLKVYAPLAEAEGAWVVKTELEDLSFSHISPEYYKSVEEEIDSDLRLSEYSKGFWRSKLELMLSEMNLKGRVDVKKNGYWSIVKKRRKASVLKESALTDFSDINDIVSYRVIMESEDDCYRFLGQIHKELGEIIDFNRDDIFMWANKRDNGYQALQTTLDTPDGAVEIAMMTEGMEEFNNWGVISKIREGEMDLSEYKLKLVFTPTGDVKFMKPESSGVDLSYMISSSLGADACEMLIDGKVVPITTVIPNATVVEIITTDETRIAPDSQLLQFSLPETKRLINRQLIIEANQRMILEARKFLSETMLSKRGLLDLNDLDGNLRKMVLNRFGVTDVDSLCLELAESHDKDNFVIKIEKRLDELGISKENMKLSTVMVTGIDKPGVLVEMATWISENGGNVMKVSHEPEGNRYELRFVVTNMSKEGENFIRDSLAEDERFDEWAVV